MLRFKILASVVPLLAAAVFARSEIGSVSHPCIALGDTSVELTSLFWTAGVHVAFTDDPARATVRVQITEDADAADFAVVDDGLGSESESCQAKPLDSPDLDCRAARRRRSGDLSLHRGAGGLPCLCALENLLAARGGGADRRRPRRPPPSPGRLALSRVALRR
ncbi:hypothetical protein ACVWZV_001669 [Bradyrhizobium sp. GM5.1]